MHSQASGLEPAVFLLRKNSPQIRAFKESFVIRSTKILELAAEITPN